MDSVVPSPTLVKLETLLEAHIIHDHTAGMNGNKDRSFMIEKIAKKIGHGVRPSSTLVNVTDCTG